MGGNSASAMAAPVTISATAKHTASVIFLHGLGDTGHGWATALQQIQSPYVKYICPTAPVMSVTLSAGFQMNSWFDLRSLDPSGPEDEEGIVRATAIVHQLIEDEVKAGIPANRILLGGFSQGGALAIYSALKYSNRLAGILGCSCWLPLHSQFPQAAVSNKDAPLLQCHGDADDIVPYKWGQMTSQVLKTFMNNSKFNTYPGVSHSTNDREMSDMKNFIEQCVPPV